MNLSQGLVQQQSQQLVLNQALRQSIEILGLSSQDLSVRIQKEVLENPVLEEVNETRDAAWPVNTVQVDTDANKNTRESDAAGVEDGDTPWPPKSRASFDDLFLGNNGGMGKTERKHQFIQNAIRTRESLADHLLWQLRMTTLSPGGQEMGTAIISAIDERGFLIHELTELFSQHKLTQARQVLAVIQDLDPIGCGARTIAGSLLIQARHLRPEDKDTQLLLEEHFSDLERLDFKAIEKSTALSWSDIQKSLYFIRGLAPYPGTLYAPQLSEYLVPDIIVYNINGELQLILNDDWLPALQITSGYEDMLKSLNIKKEHDYLKGKFNSAQILIHSVRRRRQTLAQVAKAIVEYQKDFFLQGPEHLHPLVLRTIARELDIHESTVSRAIANKYIQTQWGSFELKYFFTGSLKNTSAQRGDISTRNIQGRIRSLIEKEDAQAPLSDQELVSRLQEDGVQIARRTVAKYRKLMDIPSIKQRRKLNLSRLKMGVKL